MVEITEIGSDRPATQVRPIGIHKMDVAIGLGLIALLAFRSERLGAA